MTNPSPSPTEPRRSQFWVLLLLVVAMGVLYLATQRRSHVPEGWLTNLTEARQQATGGKLIFVEFGAGWCPPCQQMRRDVFPDARVQAALSDFVRVECDIDEQPNVADQYDIRSLPTLVVMNSAGKVLARIEGGLPATELLRFLKSATTPAKE